MSSPAPSASRPPSSSSSSVFGQCWSCRLLCGSGLILAGGFVFAGARSIMARGSGPPGPGIITQLVFALGLASWGTALLMDPVGKAERKM
ncbi:distal membrane-arm assembly complex protein 1 [Rhinatrema bivittatum]|uniref:distal membrane-arm assembly complex protein 1 n=1 Tax=Rhinatrema bivittatum TaxID=194408 RepID=UPI00112D812B|nr:distal membrane-arm assembly complex protein 1 [Rhinatrema bivittatum]